MEFSKALVQLSLHITHLRYSLVPIMADRNVFIFVVLALFLMQMHWKTTQLKLFIVNVFTFND